MQLHTIAPEHPFRKARRIGRGGKAGTYSGRGIKGQRSRAGAKIRPAERDILKQLPKLRGYAFNPIREKPAVVNLDAIERAFPEGALVSPASLHGRGLVRRVKGRLPRVKILARGGTRKRLIFKGVAFSASAREKTLR